MLGGDLIFEKAKAVKPPQPVLWQRPFLGFWFLCMCLSHLFRDT